MLLLVCHAPIHVHSMTLEQHSDYQTCMATTCLRCERKTQELDRVLRLWCARESSSGGEQHDARYGDAAGRHSLVVINRAAPRPTAVHARCEYMLALPLLRAWVGREHSRGCCSRAHTAAACPAPPLLLSSKPPTRISPHF